MPAAGELLLRATAGVDEAGRGPLAGPVVAAAVILDPGRVPDGIADSKRLSARRREELAEELREVAVAIAVGSASVAEIDDINILQATFLAMRRAVAALAVAPRRVLVDGAHCPAFGCPGEAVVGGDGRIACIGAASIIAKVARDRELVALDDRYPGYGFAAHKGYGTRTHLEALARLGPCPLHRRTFAPVRAALAAQTAGAA